MTDEKIVKIFKMNDCDWYAAVDMKSAIEQITRDTGNTCEECVDFYAHELTDDEMDRLQFMDFFSDRENDEDTEDGSGSFREQLALMIDRGDSFPCMFASTEF